MVPVAGRLCVITINDVAGRADVDLAEVGRGNVTVVECRADVVVHVVPQIRAHVGRARVADTR